MRTSFPGYFPFPAIMMLLIHDIQTQLNDEQLTVAPKYELVDAFREKFLL